MRRRRLAWKVLPYFLGTVVVSLLLVGLYASRQIRSLYFDEISVALESRARIVAEELRPSLGLLDPAEIDARCDELGPLTNTRITVVDSLGKVLGDSDGDPVTMGNHATRAEIAAALRGEVGLEQRYSNTLQRTMIYVAVPIVRDGLTVGAVRTSEPLAAIEPALSALYYRLLLVGLLVAVAATLIGLLVFRRQTRHLVKLKEGAQRFAAGDLSTGLTVPDTEEIAALAESMNSMAAQLDARIKTVVEQRNERDAIFAGMSEGILALDAEDRLTSINLAAARMLRLDSERSVGQSVFGLLRISALHDLVRQTAAAEEAVESEIIISGTEDRNVLARASALQDASGERLGTLIVLNDITRQRRLESVRKDFVANVSHELKTPIAAIRGSVETLLDGALDNPSDARRFVTMIDGQSARLASLLEDLLSLARIENSTAKHDIKHVSTNLAEVIKAAFQVCATAAKARNIRIVCLCPEDLQVELDRGMIDQALVNLIDNALRYSDEGTVVTVEAAAQGGDVTISVRDQGCGIEARHLPRLFERFYRVDSARSRATGGTGLGLAIVKHVALAHGGRVEVASTVGKGSTFTLTVPVRRI